MTRLGVTRKLEYPADRGLFGHVHETRSEESAHTFSTCNDTCGDCLYMANNKGSGHRRGRGRGSKSIWNKRQGSLRNIKHFGIRRAVGYVQLE
jgi:hypothetical protein